MAITSEAAVYILKYSSAVVQAAFESGAAGDEQGVEDAFELQHEVAEKARVSGFQGFVFWKGRFGGMRVGGGRLALGASARL